MPMTCRCGAYLVEEITDEGVKPLGGSEIAFRRGTDYIVCSVCHSVYRVSDLQAGKSMDDSLVGVEEDEGSAVESLEHLFETGGDEEP